MERGSGLYVVLECVRGKGERDPDRAFVSCTAMRIGLHIMAVH